MATWIVHLRIADIFIKEQLIPDNHKKEFICGSLAPDCGYGIKDSFGDFSPPPSVTHWTPDGCKIFCEYNNFYDTYLKGKEANADYYLYLGYYMHLLTDFRSYQQSLRSRGDQLIRYFWPWRSLPLLLN